MSSDERTPARGADDTDSAAGAARSAQPLPPVEGNPRGEPGSADAPHQPQSGRAGSGQDAELQSIGQSQSDRAAGKSS